MGDVDVGGRGKGKGESADRGEVIPGPIVEVGDNEVGIGKLGGSRVDDDDVGEVM